MPNEKRPLLLTLEYPPQDSPQTIPQEPLGTPKYGGVATYLAAEVKASSEPVEVVKAQEHFWDKWPRWIPLLWFKHPEVDTILWISHVLPMGYVALWWKWRFKTPYRVYVHGLDLVNARRGSWKRYWASRILHRADEIVANSRQTAELLSSFGVNPSQAEIRYPRVLGVDVAQYRGVGDELRKKYGIGPHPLLVTISRLVARKGINLVIRSLTEVWKQVPELRYVIVGGGEERKRLETLALSALTELESVRPRLLTSKKILFAGEVPDEEKYAWLSACDCFILTPIDDPEDFEGYGIVYKEAQLFGKPVIGSRVGGVPEAIGENGMLVDSGSIEQITDAILKHVKA
ncbi:MAG: glycosyltransferase family 4 protein [Parcubacteria group bacterium]|nr:glycosyltransferase family 4 protein [Parcubacteria group bacterium]